MIDVEVLRPGLATTIQSWPGRTGFWPVGVPPSGPMDDLSFRLGNWALHNPAGAAGLECTASGPALRFSAATAVCLTGAPVPAVLDGRPVPPWQWVPVPADAVLDVPAIPGPGLRCYLLFAGGLEVPETLGSTATFPMGALGGHGGRPLQAGDVLTVAGRPPARPRRVPQDNRPSIGRDWQLAVTEGPHGAPEFLTRTDIATILTSDYTVHPHSDRTGVRLVGPKPRWARPDGGQAGLHPSNIHDTAYSVGALDFTGDTPILLGPDGPSLGGFVCPVTVTRADRWKLGQLAPGDTVRFVAVPADRAPTPDLLTASRRAAFPAVLPSGGDGDDGVLHRHVGADGTALTVRRSGEAAVLVEYGEMTLDLALRARVQVLADRLRDLAIPGVTESTPGVRSLQVGFSPERLRAAELTALIAEADDALPSCDELAVPSRTVRLPLSWDDPAIRTAIDRYQRSVRADAPWCPSNIEFTRRINGLADVADVYNIVFAAQYLVLGLGDIYLGAPVATPVDPRHRLVTTKYNPARTWTPENAVGIGGAYLCVYGVEGLGGYQLIGRTTQVWDRRRTAVDVHDPEPPWLLRYFDRIVFHPVSSTELTDLRADLAAGRGTLDAEPGEFALAEYRRSLEDDAASIAAFAQRQAAAFAAERAAWHARGEFTPLSSP